jgi:YrbI family 3-deoxy-D-manno-octulosonate 8-phosphate phosphatase
MRTPESIRVIALDVDGVLTDGGMYYSARGEVMKKFNARDGKAAEYLRAKGYVIALITGETTPIVAQRAKKLGIADVYLGCRDKCAAAADLLRRHHASFGQLLYCGDDRGDVGLLRKAGFSCCPADATARAREAADVRLSRRGGEGVLAEIADRLEKAEG